MNLNRDIFGDRTKLGVLLDPDFEKEPNYRQLLQHLSDGFADLVLVGGSSSHQDNFNAMIRELKQRLSQKVLLFPGNTLQLSSSADGLLLPSLISGRNPD